jgi:tRNA (guanine-N7-)-methyltransferase
MIDRQHERSVRSFVIRGGRTTLAQQRALAELWPSYGIEWSEQPLDLDSLFGRRAPRIAEIGFGSGENLLQLAARQPQCDYLGIEVHPPGVGRLLLALAARQLTNVRVSRHDAVEVFARQIAPASFDEILVLFPDPWHKKRHHKRRLIQSEFAAILASRLKLGGVLTLATDWQPYAEHMLQVLNSCALLQNSSADAGYAPPSAERAPTRFERRGTRLGHEVFELSYRRR